MNAQTTLVGAQVGAGGQIVVEKGGSEFDSILDAVATETVLSGGEADGTGIDGGTQTVANGGFAELVFVGNGGEQIVQDGGSVNVSYIDAGGGVDYQSGGASTGFADFLQTGGTVQFDGAKISSVPIYGFGVGDKIDLSNYSGETNYTFTDGDLTVNFGDEGSVSLDLPDTDPNATFHFTSFGANGTEISIVPCFCVGTLIRTEGGEVAVETLKRGDLVMTTQGVAKPVSWIGRRAVSAAFADPVRCWPIRVKAGALDENVPSRDLLLSPDHALLVGGVLVQAGALVNGASIVRERSVPPVCSSIITSNWTIIR